MAVLFVLSVAGVALARLPRVWRAVYRYQPGGIGAPVGVMVVPRPALLQYWRGGGGNAATRLRLPDTTSCWAWWRRSLSWRHLRWCPTAVCLHRTGLVGAPAVLSWVTMLLCLIFRNYGSQLGDREALQVAQNAVIAEERASMERFHAYFDHSTVGLPSPAWKRLGRGQ